VGLRAEKCETGRARRCMQMSRPGDSQYRNEELILGRYSFQAINDQHPERQSFRRHFQA